MSHLHSVYDSDMHFSINPVTRAIQNESPKNSLVQYDHNSERFTFELPRYIEEHDMSHCNRVEVHYINIGRSGDQKAGVYEVDDCQISLRDNGVVICSWLISSNATRYAGYLAFLIRFACVAADGTIEYAWHTEIYKGIAVTDGMSNGEAIVEEYADVLEQWKNAINGAGYITLADTVSVYEFADYDNFHLGVLGGYVDMSLLPVGKRVRIKNTNIPLLYVSGQPTSGYGDIPDTEQDFITKLNNTGEVSYYGIALRDYAKDSGMVSGGGGGTATNVPTKVSELENDAGYLTADEVPITSTEDSVTLNGKDFLEIESSDTMTVKTRNAMSIESENDMYFRATNIGVTGDMTVQDPVGGTSVANKGYVDGKETAHNASTTAHNDIRQLISGLTSRLNALADSDDTTLDQLSEIVAYIKANKSLIDSITTSKVNVSDIIDNLTTSVSNKPLSAKMGVELKKLIDAIVIPTSLPASDVYSWAKQPTKPTYTAAEVGAATPAYVDNKVNEIIKSAESIPEYWLAELETKADAIQQAMEKAGRNKSAFLWYTDAHWVNGNSKMSPVLLDYLYHNTPMNKVNFGGDIIGDSLLASREEMKYLYEWREAIKGLPNHHSVLGNHDMFASDTVDYEDDNYRYAFLLAPEESSDMVMGDGNYYYIDNPCEKTRYLHFAYLTSGHTAMMAQGQFMVDAIKGVPEGWHIVAIAHRWWQYSSASTPTTGSIPAFETEMLSVFDAYNARTTRGGSNYFTAQDFASAKGRVEFCIAGHIHVDYDFETEGGIPVIVTTADTNQNRVPDSTVDSGTVGTTTEAAVFGIIADYNDTDNTKITVVGVGRGTSRVVRKSSVKLTSISDITYSGDTTVGAAIDASKFSFKANYSNGTTDTVNGATSVSPATVGIVGNNTVTITYTEGNVSVSGTMTIVGTPVPVVNLLNLDRSYVDGTSGASMNASSLNENSAYKNVSYSNLVFNDKSCAVSDISENGVTITEPGVGGICVSYPVHLSDIDTQDYKLSFDYTGDGSTRIYFKYGRADGTFSTSQTAFNTAGSGHADVTIPRADTNNGTGFEWLILSVGTNTSKTTTLSNVLLTKS